MMERCGMSVMGLKKSFSKPVFIRIYYIAPSPLFYTQQLTPKLSIPCPSQPFPPPSSSLPPTLPTIKQTLGNPEGGAIHEVIMAKTRILEGVGRGGEGGNWFRFFHPTSLSHLGKYHIPVDKKICFSGLFFKTRKEIFIAVEF